MSALLDIPLRLKGGAFCTDVPAGDYTHSGPVMEHNASPPISPPDYRFPDAPPLQFPTIVSPPSSPSDSPSTSTSALPCSSDSPSLSLRRSPTDSLIFSQSPTSPPFLSIRDLYLPTLTPDEILDTLDHLAATAPKKKSHARKQPAGHIPRPRNAFILFRCLFVSQQAVPASVEKDHRNISRIAGKVWKSMSNEEKEPWVKASELEKTRHEAKWPGYRYNPVQSQALPRRFAQGANKVPDSESERQVRAAARIRLKDEDEDDSSYVARPISKYSRVGSVPPPPQQSSQNEWERDGKCAHVASLVREGKQGQELEAAIRGYASPRPVDSYFPDALMRPPGLPSPNPFVGAPTTPTTTRFPRATTPSAYEMSLPPDSPPPQTHIRLTMRRSSSCPPLPPLGPVSFPFDNPNPWLASAYGPYATSSLPSPSPFTFTFPLAPSAPQPHSPFDSPFAFPPPSPFPGHELEAQDEHRPLTAPQQQHHELPPRLNLDASSRLMHRRGSSLDRAIASSSIAGAFGGGLPKSTFGNSQWAPDAFLRQNHVDSFLSGHATPTEFTGSSGERTPALTPQSSFESSSESELGQRGRPNTVRTLEMPSDPAQDAAVCENAERGRPRLEHTLAYSRAAPEFIEQFSSRMCSPPSPRAKISARLFGSQGARLGLDLDLDIPLSLDVSFHSPPPPSASTVYSTQNSAPGISPESAYPYTPSSPLGAGDAQRYNFSYTQALMDTDPDVGADEFHASS